MLRNKTSMGVNGWQQPLAGGLYSCSLPLLAVHALPGWR